MRHGFLGLAVVLGLGTFSTPAKAQDGGFSDPFFLYYGYYLPRQAALAAQPQVEDYYRQRSAERQYTALTDREGGLTDPLGGSIFDQDDPTAAFGTRSGRSRLVRTTPTGMVNQNLTGAGTAGYFNRTGSYYPTIRSGRGRNNASRANSALSAIGGGGMRGAFRPNPFAGMTPVGRGFGLPAPKR